MSSSKIRPVNRGGLKLLPVLALVLLLLAAAACGSSSSGSTSTPSASATSGGVWGPSDLAALKADSSLKAMLPSGMTTISVASDIPYPPWEYYVSGTKTPTGFDYELSQALGKIIGVPVTFNEQPFSGIILSVKAGKYDMIMSDMYDNAVREKVLNFVDYAYDTTSILTKKGNPNGLSNLDSLAGKTVGVESGTTQQVLLADLNTQFKNAGKPTMNILQLPDQPSALLAITSGRAVGDATDHSTAEYIAKTVGNGNTFEVVTDPAAPSGYQPQVVGVGIIKSNTQLLSVVQKALQDLIDQGAYQKIVAKYSLVNQGSKPVPGASATP